MRKRAAVDARLADELDLYRETVGMVDAADDETWADLLRWVEDDFFRRQTERLGDFQQTGEDLERHLLLGTASRGDWERFVTFALMALNLRNLAGSLDSELVTSALARERPALAATLIEDLPDSARRARARAVLVAHGRDVDLGPHQDLLLADVEAAAPRSQDDVEAVARWATLLADLARLVGPGLKAAWRRWLPRLDGFPEQQAQVLHALLRAFLAAGDVDSDTLWWCWAGIDEEESFDAASWLPDPLPASLAETPWPFLDRLLTRRSDGGDRLAWRVALGLLGRRCSGDALRAREGWSWIVSHGGPRSWDADSVWAGAQLWPTLPEEVLDRVAAVSDAAARAALWVAVLEGSGGRGAGAAAVEAVDGIASATDFVRWELRRLGTLDGVLGGDDLHRLQHALRSLVRLGFRVPAEDLHAALELVAEHRPRRLRRWLQRSFRAAATTPERLMTVVRLSRSPVLLAELHRRAERWAAEVAPDVPSGFELRCRLLTLLTVRLCLGEGGLESFARTVERLLPQEEDELRGELAVALAEAGRGDDCDEVLAGIRSPARLLRARVALIAVRGQADGTLSPAQLYIAVANPAAVAEELAAFDAGEERSDGPAGWSRSDDPLRRLVMEMARARWRLDRQRRLYPLEEQDREAALLSVRGELSGIEEEERLVALAAQLAALGSALGVAAATLEHLQGIRLVLMARGVAEDRRRDALVDLLCGGEVCFLSDDEGAPLRGVRPGRRRRAWRDFLRRAFRLPVEGADLVRSDELGASWGLALPLLVALDERRCQGEQGRLSRLLGRHRPIDWQRDLPAVILDTAGELIELCSATPRHRVALARQWCSTAAAPAAQYAEALAWLLAGEHPRLAGDLVLRIADPVRRASATLRLVRGGWLDGSTVHRLATVMPAAAAARLRLLRLPAGDPFRHGDSWLPSLTAVLARGGWRCGDAELAALRRAFRDGETPRCLPGLAQAVIDAFGRDDVAAAEEALRLFVHVWVRPSRIKAAQRAVEAARSLERSDVPPGESAPPGESGEPGESGPKAGDEGGASVADGDEELQARRAVAVYKRNRRAFRAPRWTGHLRRPERLGFMIVTYLTLCSTPVDFLATATATGQSLWRPPSWAQILALLVCSALVVVNAKVVAQGQEVEAGSGPLRRWGRWWIGGLPWVGLWALVEAPAGDVGRDGAGGAWVRRSNNVVLIAGLNLFVVLPCTFVLPSSPQLQVGLAAALRTTGFAMALKTHRLVISQTAARGWLAAALFAAPLIWLAPWPGTPWLGLLLLVLFDLSEMAGRGERTLTARLQGEGGELSRNALWTGLEHRLRHLVPRLPWHQRLGSWSERFDRCESAGWTEARVLHWYRAKGGLLLFEGAWLVHQWRLAPRLCEQLADALFALGVSALLVLIVLRMVARLHLGVAPHLFPLRLVVWSACPLAGGLLLGGAFGGAAELAPRLSLGAAVCLVAVFFSTLDLLPPTPEQTLEGDRWKMYWLAMALSAMVLGTGLSQPGAVERTRLLVADLLAVVPLVDMLVSACLLRALLSPWRPPQVRVRWLPLPLRARLVMLMLIGLLPCGGVALPAVYYLRRRLTVQLERRAEPSRSAPLLRAG